MGPPEFTGGNWAGGTRWVGGAGRRFNGAAGIHRRKPGRRRMMKPADHFGFNGAAGIHRRKPAQVGDTQ